MKSFYELNEGIPKAFHAFGFAALGSTLTALAALIYAKQTGDTELFNLAMNVFRTSGGALAGVSGILNVFNRNDESVVGWEFIKKMFAQVTPQQQSAIKAKVAAYADGSANPRQELQSILMGQK